MSPLSMTKPSSQRRLWLAVNLAVFRNNTTAENSAPFFFTSLMFVSLCGMYRMYNPFPLNSEFIVHTMMEF